MDKVDLEKDNRTFWREVNRMMGRRGREDVINLKDEQGRELETRDRWQEPSEGGWKRPLE